MNRKKLVEVAVRVGALVAFAGAMVAAAAPAHAAWAFGAFGSFKAVGSVGTCQTSGGTTGFSSATSSQIAAWSPTLANFATQTQGFPTNNTALAPNVTPGVSNTVWVSSPNNTHHRCRVGVWVE